MLILPLANTIELTQLATWILGTGAIVVALAAIWKFVTNMSQLVNFVQVHTPVLITIAEQFKKNGGNTLKDQIDRIELQASSAERVAREARTAAQEATKLWIRTDANVSSILRLVSSSHSVTLPPQELAEILTDGA